jgi:putative transposase
MVEEDAAVEESTTLPISGPMPATKGPRTDILRDGARRLFAEAVEAEVAARIDAHAHLKDAAGRRQVVRNGHLPERTIQTGLGGLGLKRPRVHDRRPDDRREPFASAILPPSLRPTRSLEELIPWLDLKGVSTGDFSEALQAILGPDAPGLSATTITRLKPTWEGEYEAWSKRSPEGKRYAYVRADGVHFNIRLAQDRQCILVLMGATARGKKERDGALGFWKAIGQVWPSTRGQRCWVHKTSNILDKLPKGSQPRVKAALREIYEAETKAGAEKAFDLFVTTYEAKYPKATECLAKGRESLLAFHDFPAGHWRHIRTTNPIESAFATVRLRTVETKGSGSRVACLTMVFELMESASRSWRSLNGSPRLRAVISGAKFVDGIEVKDAA